VLARSTRHKSTISWAGRKGQRWWRPACNVEHGGEEATVAAAMGVVANGGGDDGSKSKSYRVAMAATGEEIITKS